MRRKQVLADLGCRNTVFNAQAQSAISLLPRLRAAGVRRFRVELVDEPAAAVAPLLDAYRTALAEPSRVRELWRWLKDIPDSNGNAQGVTLGSLAVSEERTREEMKAPRLR